MKTEEVIAWRPSSQDKEFVKTLAGGIPRKSVPEWLSLDTDSLTGKVLRLPGADDAGAVEVACGERGEQMRAAILDGVNFAVDVGDTNPSAVDLRYRHASRR